MKRSLKFAFNFVIAVTGSLNAIPDVSFFDTTFSDTNWVPTATLTTGLGGSASGGQTNASGNDFLQLTISNNGNRSGVAAYYHNGGFNYKPTVQGAITNLGYSVQLMAISSVTIPPVAFPSPVVRQNGTNYAATAFSPPNATWTPFSANGL